mmetsp:Transcript_19808/g.24020  ORF Transcript_19808/g.24020 Transcript_19808/m.24020 type:complete len:188 (+) Transcript_19808:238-801(+)|eukprot:CAMPEP_0204837072 /NCGR_PEP_ID=MMETSP1346-20131115/27067_1 /ASSEMBLY_ACC=CAM_ASM_000771 /TAXON_ID=215587 /ORGANISM="Aplanochytrium stocchinoi, Strain GSBS06" /LENGTH=187 /DNA_ID=CAMNT_0051972311 /DNA_START=169 /DNA_END=732 /DNA_ORIENTATION=-
MELDLELLRSKGITTIAFDMDLTAVRQHSWGRLHRNELGAYLEKTSEDFKAIVPQLLDTHGFNIAICTRSDTAQYNANKDIHPDTHIVGDELVNEVLKHAGFAEEIRKKIFVIGYNHKAHGDEGLKEKNLLKRRHIRKVCQHFEVTPREILLFDDEQENVDDCERLGVFCVKIDPEQGFLFSDFPFR